MRTSHHHQTSRHSATEHGASTSILHLTLFLASVLISAQVILTPLASSSTVLRRVFLGLPLLHLSWGFHSRACLTIYRVSQEECARLRQGVSYVKVYRYNPKHLCPKLNAYGDNGQRKVWSSGGSTHCTCHLTSLIDVCPWVWCPITESQLTLALYQDAHSAMLRQCLPYMSCIVLGTLRTTMTCVRVFL